LVSVTIHWLEEDFEDSAKMDHSADAHRTDLMTITRFVLNEQSKHPESRGDFTILLNNIVLGCKFVCSAVNKVDSFTLFFFSNMFFCFVFIFHRFSALDVIWDFELPCSGPYCYQWFSFVVVFVDTAWLKKVDME